MLPHIFQNLLWDVDAHQVDLKSHQAWVIARVLSRGSLEQVRTLENLLGKEAFSDFFLEGGSSKVDPQTATFWMTLLNLTKEQCTPKSSTKINWTF